MHGPQRFQIHRSDRLDLLPTAHTCFNQVQWLDIGTVIMAGRLFFWQMVFCSWICLPMAHMKRWSQCYWPLLGDPSRIVASVYVYVLHITASAGKGALASDSFDLSPALQRATFRNLFKITLKNWGKFYSFVWIEKRPQDYLWLKS